MQIKLLQNEDTKGLFLFELENRQYFESIGLGRQDGYYKMKEFDLIAQQLLKNQIDRTDYFYLIINDKEEIVGRINLIDIVYAPVATAEMGYRIGEKYQQKGYASKAVQMVLQEAKEIHKLCKIKAGVSPQNIASQKVLIKNGFAPSPKKYKHILKTGKEAESLLFEKAL